MKKLFYLSAILALIFSCKSPDSVKLDSKSTSSLKGNYQILDVSYDGSTMFKINLFEVAETKCFVGSSWNFIANNNTGSFNLSAAGCPSYETKITWYVNNEGGFVMKLLDNNKARKVKDGYVLALKNVTDTGFQLVDRVNVGGKMTDLTIQFVKK